MTSFYKSISYLSLALFSTSVLAVEPGALAPRDSSIEEINSEVDLEKVVKKSSDIDLPTELESDKAKDISKEESIEYLKKHPQELEKILGVMLARGSKEGLEKLLPIYSEYKNKDQSVIDWGNAIIKARSGKLKEAITIYRDINAKLPEVKTLRFQLAMALFYNGQYDAARIEFEKLRSSTTLETDIESINSYLEAINKKNDWSFYANVSYLDDDNIANSPLQGTKIVGNNGSAVTFSSPRETGKGFSYGVNADKKWLDDGGSFAAVHLSSNGNFYLNNRKFNDVTAEFGAGVGYKNLTTETELTTFTSKRLFGGGIGSNGNLKSYTDTGGIKINVNQWISTQLRYQGLYRFSYSQYAEKYAHNNGKDNLFANSVVYFPNQNQYWTAGTDYLTKDAVDESSSYDRRGMSVGWGQTWGRGFSTRLNLGYAQRDYKAKNFFGIKRENEEYSAGLSIWNRSLHIEGLTPRLKFDYFEVKSNSPFDEYKKYNTSVELTKTF